MTRQPYRKPLPPALAPAERMARRQQAKAKAKEQRMAKKVVTRYAGLVYDYALIDEDKRERVQDAALDIKRRLKRTAEDVIAIGKQLIEIEPLLSGKFAKWFKTEFNMDERSARNFIYAAEQYGDKPEIISGLDVTTLYLMAAPSTPPAARAALETQIAAGDIPKPAAAKRTVDEHKPPKQLPAPAEPEPATISAEYTVVSSHLSFAEWWALMPQAEMSLADWLLVFQTAKIGAADAGVLAPRLKLAITNVMLSWSKFVNAVEKELKNE